MSTKKLMRWTNNDSEGTRSFPSFGTKLLGLACLSLLAVQTAFAQEPPNNNFADATLITGSSAQVSGSNVNATPQAGEPSSVTFGGDRQPTGGRSVWWRWTAPALGSTTVSTGVRGQPPGPPQASSFDTQLGVYTGSSFPLNEVVSTEDHPLYAGGLSEVTFTATAGTTYSIMVDGFEGAQGSIVLYLTQAGGGGPTNHTIAASASPADGGMISGAGTYEAGQPASLVADAEPGFEFVNWTEGGASVSTTPTYTFTVSGDRTLVANFSGAPDTNNVTIAVSVNPAGAGTVSGGGLVAIGTNVNLTATASGNNTFVNWTEGGTVVGTNVTLTFTAETSRTLVANFSVPVPPVQIEFLEAVNIRLVATSQGEPRMNERTGVITHRTIRTRISNRQVLDALGTFPTRARLVMVDRNRFEVRDRDTVLADVSSAFTQGKGAVSVLQGTEFPADDGRETLTEHFIYTLTLRNGTTLDVTVNGLASERTFVRRENNEGVARAGSSLSANVAGEGQVPELGASLLSGRVTISGSGTVDRQP